MLDHLRHVTPQNSSNETLHLSQENLRWHERVLESISQGILICDAQEPGTPIIYVNPAFERMTGYRHEEVVGRNPRFLLGPNPDPAALTKIECALHEQRSVIIDCIHYRKNGDSFWNSMTISPVRHEDGNVTHVVGVMNDVTERRQAETAIRESQSRFAGILDVAEDAIISVDESQRICLFNRGAEKIFGYVAQEVLGQRLEVLLPERVVQAHSGHVAAFAASSVVSRRFEERQRLSGRRKDGQEFPAEGSISKIEINGQKILTVMLRDITEWRRGDEDLQASHALLRAVTDGTPDTVFVKDRDGRYLMVNTAGASLVDRSPKEVLGRTDFDLFPPELATQFMTADLEVMNTNQTKVLEYVLTRAGKPCTFLATKSPYHDHHGQIIGVIGIGHDITERKSLEAQFLQAQKLEAIGRLAGGVAHDFNNLLTVICGVGEMLMAKLPDDSPSRELLQMINHAGERAGMLTHQLLAFTRQQIVAPEVLDLREAVNETLKMLGRIIGEDIQLVTIHDPEPVMIRADPGHITQVLLNLAVNARDAMPHGGKLTLQTQNIQLTEEEVRSRPAVKPGAYALLAVEDTGSGMDEKVLAHIFEPFFTTKETGKGTGLGLATVHGIVHQSGGHIQVVSVPEKGSTFRVNFPRALQSSSTRLSLQGSATIVPRGQETLLLVEDESEILVLSRMILESGGYTILAARDGDEALEEARGHPGQIDMLVTDVVMPRMSGRELADQLRRMRPGIRILYLSGYTDDTVVRHGINDQEVAFLMKPFTPAGLARKVRQVLDESRVRNQESGVNE